MAFPCDFIDATRALRSDQQVQVAKAALEHLGLDAYKVPKGLVFAVNEAFRAHELPMIGTQLEPLNNEMVDHPNSLNAHINRYESAVVIGSSKGSFQVTRLVNNISAVFGDSRIVVIASTKGQAIDVLNMLRKNKHHAWYLDDEYKVHEDQPRPNHRIRLTTLKGLGLCSLQLHQADIVVVLDALGFVNHPDTACLFMPNWGTQLKKAARLVGLVDLETPATSLQKVWALFGLKTFGLDENGAAWSSPRVTWFGSAANRLKFNQARLAICPNLELLRASAWENTERNNHLLRKARAVQHEFAGFKFVEERSTDEMVGILLANEIQKHAVQKLQNREEKFRFYLIEEINEPGILLPPILLRGDAGCGIFKLNRKWPTWIIDLEDKRGYLAKRFKKRRISYIKHWHAGPTPFGSKWQLTLAKPNPV